MKDGCLFWFDQQESWSLLSQFAFELQVTPAISNITQQRFSIGGLIHDKNCNVCSRLGFVQFGVQTLCTLSGRWFIDLERRITWRDSHTLSNYQVQQKLISQKPPSAIHTDVNLALRLPAFKWSNSQLPTWWPSDLDTVYRMDQIECIR